MRRLRWAFLVLVLVLFAFLIPSTFSQESSPTVTHTPNAETICKKNLCTTALYSYEKFFHNTSTNQWVEINETFFPCPVGEKIQYCTNDYHYKVVANAQGIITAFIENKSFSFSFGTWLEIGKNQNCPDWKKSINYQRNRASRQRNKILFQ